MTLPKAEYNGYVYLPFKEFVNSEGGSVNTSNPNFVAFKYQIASSDVIDTYFGELGLWREGDSGLKNTGKLNIGLGVELNSNKEYMYYDSLMFNKATAQDWATAKLSGFEATAQYKVKGYYPEDANSSLKLTTTGTSKSSVPFKPSPIRMGQPTVKGVKPFSHAQ